MINIKHVPRQSLMMKNKWSCHNRGSFHNGKNRSGVHNGGSVYHGNGVGDGDRGSPDNGDGGYYWGGLDHHRWRMRDNCAVAGVWSGRWYRYKARSGGGEGDDGSESQLKRNRT